MLIGFTLFIEAHLSIVVSERALGIFTIRSRAIHAKLSGLRGDLVTL